MTNIRALFDEEMPDPEFITPDSQGVPMFAFGVEFFHEGGCWTFHIWAYSQSDAEKRVQSLRESAAVYGQIYSQSPDDDPSPPRKRRAA